MSRVLAGLSCYDHDLRIMAGCATVIKDPRGENRPPTCAGYQLPATILWSSIKFQRWCMSSYNRGNPGVFVPEQVWAEFEDLIGVVQVFAATLDGPNRPILMNSNSLNAFCSTVERTLLKVSESAIYLPELSQTGINNENSHE